MGKKRITLSKFHKVFSKPLKSKRPVTPYHIVGFVLLAVVLTAIPFYFFGKSEGYTQKTSEIEKQETKEAQQNLMKLPLKDVQDIFLKYLMIRTMFWLPIILVVLGIGWIIHGIF